MPRKITSLDPTVVPAKPEETFDEMEVEMFRIVKTTEGLRLRARLQKVDSEGDALPGETFSVNIKNLDSQMAVTPKFAAAWDTIVDVMGLAYEFYCLRDKVTEAINNGEDAVALIEQRDLALAALRGPVA